VDVVSECSKGCGRKATRRSMCNSCYQTYRNKQVAYGRWQTVTVDAGPVRAHLLALKAAGIGDRRIGELSGVSRSALQKMSRNRPGTDQPLRSNVWRSTANRILAIPLEVDNRNYGVRIDATGSLRRLRALHAIGWTQTEMARRIGWTLQNLNRYFISDPDRINRSTAVEIARVFNELQLIPGPSDRARRHARKQGWAPPLAWDEDAIDDPAARGGDVPGAVHRAARARLPRPANRQQARRQAGITPAATESVRHHAKSRPGHSGQLVQAPQAGRFVTQTLITLVAAVVVGMVLHTVFFR
jgi:transcriptional regulator with XRE-family HTH domain